ncbi:TIGR03943 family putative permease subunit [Microbacterium terrisoli]|uniref:TIGR03943 family putative permease subunit n=1 Tax=Microbacterium terrisoli TaxID=3242192 RepID=UPI002803FC8A|nr:DUF1980 domain-containing protein [Microbacterium protaetiae]
MRDSWGAWGGRWLGVGLASVLAVVTLGLWATGRLGLYINPSSNWFAVPMAVLVLVGAVLSFLLPAGAEADHGHDHGVGHEHDHRVGHDDVHGQAPDPGETRHRRPGGALPHSGRRRRRPSVGIGAVAVAAGGVAASVVTLSMLIVPPASLSAEIAQSRDTGAAPLFAGSDVVALATRGDTSRFGVGDWASVFATATNTDAFEGDAVTLTGFVSAAAAAGGFRLTRMVITHCVIDAQPASVPVSVSAAGSAHRSLGTGVWVSVTGTVRSTSAGKLEVDASRIERIAEPKDPYEY